MDEQAGDPFDSGENVTANARDGIAKNDAPETDSNADRIAAIEALQDDPRSPDPELESANSVLNEFEADKADEAVADEEASKLTINEVRGIVQVTAKAVREATAILERTQKAYQIASKLEAEFSAKPSLAEMNKAQVKFTATETRRKSRAMKALGELGFGKPKPNPHPQLFK